MKVKNVRVIAEIMVRTFGSGLYNIVRAIRDPYGTEWVDWNSLPEFAITAVENAEQKFRASIIAYDTVTRNPRRGMDRRQCLGLIRKLGLVAPSTTQVVALATQTIVTNEVLDVCCKQSLRRLACLVSINPEDPTYFMFGTGSENKGTFRHYNYQRVSGEDKLYFWHHGYAHDQGDEVCLEREHFAYHFPLLLGISPS